MAVQDHDHLDELATLLAAGLLRVLARKSSPVLPDRAKTLLDCAHETGGDDGRKTEDNAP